MPAGVLGGADVRGGAFGHVLGELRADRIAENLGDPPPAQPGQIGV